MTGAEGGERHTIDLETMLQSTVVDSDPAAMADSPAERAVRGCCSTTRVPKAPRTWAPDRYRAD